MYEPEVHDTVDRFEILEKLDFDLRITDEEYRSQHAIDGEIRAFAEPTDEVVQNRRHPPRSPLSVVTDAISGGDGAFPHTGMYVGLSRTPELEQDDEAFQEGVLTEAVDIEGIPENGTIALEADWEESEAERYRSDNSTKVVSEEYEVTEFPSDKLPIVVRATLERDAREYEENRGAFDDVSKAQTQVQALTGKAVLAIQIEVREYETNDPWSLRIEDFQIDMSRTFADIEWGPVEGATYNPEQKRLEWSGTTVGTGQTKDYKIYGPMEELLDLGEISARLRGRAGGSGSTTDFTLSGTQIEGVFDESGNPFPDSVPTSEEVRFTCSIEIDPTALSGDARKTADASVTVAATPNQLFDSLVSICERQGIEIRSRSPPGEAEPVPGRDGVFAVEKGEDQGELGVRREFGDQGVVYGDMVVTGTYTPTSQQSEVSAFDEAEDRLVRADEGAIDERGESTVEVSVRSTSQDLNSELIGLIEDELTGGAV